MFGIKKIEKAIYKVIVENIDKCYNWVCILARRNKELEKEIKENHKTLMDWVVSINERLNWIDKAYEENSKNIADLREFEKRVNGDYENFIGEYIKMFVADIDGIKEDIWRLQNPPKHKAGDIVLLGKLMKEKFTVLEVIPKRYEKNQLNVGSDVSFSWLYKVINNKTKETSTLAIGMLSR